MARINIEDSIYKDKRFIKLILKTGTLESAIGAVFLVWSAAQKYFISTGEIPFDAWKEQELNDDVIVCGLAYKTETGIKVRGQEEQFAWLRQRSENGLKSGESRRKKELNGRSTVAVLPQCGPEPLTLSPSLSLKKEEEHMLSDSVQVPSSKEYVMAEIAWSETLKHFGISRNMTAGDKKNFFILLRKHPVENVIAAIAGMRFENKNEKYDPAKNLFLARLLKDENFEKLMHIGLQNKTTTKNDPERLKKDLEERRKFFSKEANHDRLD